MEAKHPLQSMTVWGLLVSLAAMLLQQFGLDASEDAVAELVAAVVQVVGLVLAVYGRGNATTKLKWLSDISQAVSGKGVKTSLGIVLALSCCAVTACGGKNLTASEQARSSADVLLAAYQAADATYVQLRDTKALPDSQLKVVAHGLERSKLAIAAIGRLASLQSRVDGFIRARADSPGSPPAFEDYVPRAAVATTVSYVSLAVDSAVGVPQGEQAVLAFLSSHIGVLYGLATDALNGVAADLSTTNPPEQ